VSQSIHAWLMTHPISRDFIIAAVVGILILFLTPALNPVVFTFWRFCRIPPQRLGVWALKARLASAESRQHRVARLAHEPQYLIGYSFASLVFLGLAILLMVLASALHMDSKLHGILDHSQQPIIRNLSPLAILSFLTGYGATLIALAMASLVLDATLTPVRSASKLASRISKLRGRLQEKGIDPSSSDITAAANTPHPPCERPPAQDTANKKP